MKIAFSGNFQAIIDTHQLGSSSILYKLEISFLVTIFTSLNIKSIATKKKRRFSMIADTSHQHFRARLHKKYTFGKLFLSLTFPLSKYTGASNEHEINQVA